MTKTLAERRGRARWAATFIATAAAWVVAAPAAFAQKAGDYATNQADDAFGITIGAQIIGLYSETDIRGFNPQQAGNARIDDVYVDLVVPFGNRVRSTSSIRVGFAALDYPSPAPSGIVAYKTRLLADEHNGTLGAFSLQYNGKIIQYDFEHPFVPGKFGVVAGFGFGDSRFYDGVGNQNFAYGVMPVLNLGSWEIKAMFTGLTPMHTPTRWLARTTGAFLPPTITDRRYLGQSWTNNRINNINSGVQVRGPITEQLRFRGGVFQSRQERKTNYTEVFVVQNTAGLADHILTADPDQATFANSWEGLLSYRIDKGPLRHTLLAGARGRYRHVQSGGSQRLAFGSVQFGQKDPEVQPLFSYQPLNLSTLHQSNYSVGYVGGWKGRAQLNLGLSKTEYRAKARRAATATTPAAVTSSSASPWLYNASLLLSPAKGFAVYGGYVNGLEDSGAAPAPATNQNEQLPASRTRQIDGGVKFTAGPMKVVASVFELKKPNFSTDSINIYRELGRLRLRGLEISANGDPTPRLHVLAGVLLMDPVVSGEARTLGLVGPRPVGIPKLKVRFDASYRTDMLGGLTFTGAATYDGRRPASARTYAELGGKQLSTPAYPTFDIGFRNNFKVGGTPMSIRFVLNNVLNKRAWKPLSSNVFQLEEVRRYNLYLLADF